MQHEIMYSPSYTLLEVKLEAGERIEAEAGAMVYMSPGIEIATKAKGGVFGALTRGLLGGESFFTNTFTASSKGTLGLAPPYQGDIKHHRLNGGTLFIQSGSYMASSPELSLDTKWGGAKSFFSREGLFLLRMSGAGDAFISSFGAIHEVNLNNESFTIDTGHMVAFTEGLDYSVKRIGGFKSTIFSGEGLVAEFKGTGTLYLQTRSMNSFIDWLMPFLPKSA
ncbi:MAG: TIGR00266 family protein [Candidatus Methanoperedens sp.]|nr:TIGR00266 family protein [Candidatus Methanoperedens sp.]